MASSSQPPQVRLATAGGLNRFGIATVDGTHTLPQAVAPNTEIYSSMSVACNIGVQMLESADGRWALEQLGLRVAEIWEADPVAPYYVAGGLGAMRNHVTTFLQILRSDYPYVIIKYLPAGELANTLKGYWGVDHNYFSPKPAGIITYNRERVEAMIRAHQAWSRARPGTQTRQRCLDEYRRFLFQFACATTHELAHLFVCYLSLGPDRHTPPTVTMRGYGQTVMGDNNTRPVQTGEAGRWLENALYGGAIEYCSLPSEGNDQAGVPYLVRDINGVYYSYEIMDTSIFAVVEGRPENLRFPFQVDQQGFTDQELRQRGMRMIGTTNSNAPLPPNTRNMQSLAVMDSFRTYNITLASLRERTRHPGRDLVFTRA